MLQNEDIEESESYSDDDESLEDTSIGSGSTFANFTVKNVAEESLEPNRKNKKPPRRHIGFHIIVNTNKSKDHCDLTEYQEIRDKLGETCRKIYNSKAFPKYCELSAPSTDAGSYENVKLINRVENCSINFVIEIGPVKGLIHAHASVQFAVRALNIKLNKAKIEKFFEKEMNRYLHVYIKTHRLANETLEDYIRKSTFAKNY